MKKRLFVAISLPKDLKNIFIDYQKNYDIEGIRWTAPENLHITIYFIGYVDEDIVPNIIDKLRETFSKINSFDLEFERMSFAPPGRSPRMIWAIFKDQGVYKELSDKVYDAMKEFSRKDFRGKEAIPHVTLARFRYPSVAKGITLKQPGVENKIMQVSSCELMESKLSPSGPTHKAVAAFPFGV